MEEKRVLVEPEFPRHIAEGLAKKGHEVSTAADELSFGRGQIIQRLKGGVYAAGTEKRTDGYVAVW
jgi:gamma-glutamyltranspeptidase/glutathione hydrolase